MTTAPELAADRAGEQWMADHSWSRPHWTVAELEAAKGERTISVVLPALNEAQTVGEVVASIAPMLGGLVDELVVLDSGSSDDTEIRAVAAGARVVTREQALPEVPLQAGKGEVLWRSLAATSGDIVVFVDSDLIDPDPSFVPKLVGPLLTVPGVHLVKGFYRRPLRTPTAAAGSPNSSPARYWRPCAQNSAVCCSHWAGNTPPPANCWRRCLSLRATAWRSGCSSTPSTDSGWT